MKEEKTEESEELNTSPKTDDATFDDVLKVMGEFGLYQKLIYLIYLIVSIASIRLDITKIVIPTPVVQA